MRGFDWWLIVPVVLLISLGLLMLRSIAPGQLLFQAGFAAVAIVIFFLIALTDYQLFFSLQLPTYIFSLILLLLPFLFGLASRGALRWLQFGQFSLQPSEIVKPFLLISFSVLAVSAMRYKLPALILLFLVPALLIFFQPDLGSSLVLTAGWLVIF